MKTLTSFVFAFCGLMAAGPASFGQVTPRLSIDFMMGIPTGEFSDNVDNLGFGLDLAGGVGLSPAPIMIGAELGYLIYGFERRSEPFSTTIPDVRVDVETTNNIFMGHLFLRVQPQTGTFQPYLEGLFGFKYLFTRTSIENLATNESIASSTNFDDFASSYGLGGGLDIRVYAKEETGKRLRVLYIHLGTRYLLGSSAEYLERGSITRQDGEVVFDVTRSRTDLITPQIGVTFTF